MKQQPPERTKRLAVIAAAAVILVMVLLIIETFRLLLPGLWTAFSRRCGSWRSCRWYR